jgi:hypothetical protein
LLNGGKDFFSIGMIDLAAASRYSAIFSIIGSSLPSVSGRVTTLTAISEKPARLIKP